MNQKILLYCSVLSLFLISPIPAFAGHIYQNFEPDNGIPINIWSRTLEGVSSVVDRHDGVHLGQNAARYESGWNWNGLGINRDLVDFKELNNDRFTFWVLAFPFVTCQIWGCDTKIDNNIGIEFHDNYQYGNGGYTVWTVKKAKYQQWTKLEVLFSQLPPDFDLHSISQIQFINYWPGKYYLDDFHYVREDRVYQSFNQETRADSTNNDYGWKWNDGDTVGLSTAGEPAYDGEHSWKMVLNSHWDGGGIQSEQQNYFFNTDTNQPEESFWHNNFLPENNDRLALWVYALPENGMDNNLNVQIYDHGLHSTDQNKAEYWGKIAARFGNWTRIEVPFNKLPADLNLHDIDKIQIQNYWAGTFYIDDIRATGPHPTIKESSLAQGLVSWDAIPGAANYRLQQSIDGPNGPWITIYSGDKTNFNIYNLDQSWLQVRWEERFTDANSIPYYSPWSDIAEYNPPTVNLNFNLLLTGKLMFNNIPQAIVYELQKASDVTGPWTQLYKGPALTSPLNAAIGKWYRVRAIAEDNGNLTNFTAWSRPQVYASVGTGFVKANGTVLKNRDGNGDELVLSGYNLGNYLLTEDWMTGFGLGDNPAIPDEWTIRDILASRFGLAQTENLFKTFENAYLTDYDFDLLARAAVTLVRLPIFYRNLMDDNGNFMLNAQGQIDFSQIDRVVDAMADRGIYTLLDLHGAPGSQSAESHTGRKSYNKLFENSPSGETYRTQTETLWKEIAKHYKNNTWVLGYDLLNEPVGASTPQILADFYDRLYLAIRGIDPHHVIEMEGIWDWDTLPNPADRNWQNVVYQFHYYCPMIAEPQNQGDPVPVLGESCADYGTMNSRLSYQKAYLDAKVANSRQALYQVPAMVGEFSAHDDKPSWEYYVQTFNTQKWGWTLWSYKDRSSPSNWGILNHANYDESFPKFRATEGDGTPGDSYDDIIRKLSKYATTDYHVNNWTLKTLVKDHTLFPLYKTLKPEIFLLSSKEITSPSTFIISGRNFGTTQGTSSVKINGLPLAPIQWTNNQIEVTLPTGQALGAKKVVVMTSQGTSNEADIIVIAPKSTTEVSNLEPHPDGTFEISGEKMCDTPGTIEFSPATCVDDPPGSAACNNGIAAITSWSENLIKGFVPPDYTPGSGLSGAKIHCTYGGPLYPTMIQPNRPPILGPISNRMVSEGQLLTFGITASDPDGGSLTYSATGLPPGSTFSGQTFSWTPNYSQAETYNLTFHVSDGLATAEQTITITVLNTPLPDLIVTALNGPAVGVTGGSLSVLNTIKNQGQAASGGSVQIGIYLSTDPIITTSDLRIYSRSTSNLTTGASNTLLSKVTIPSTFAPGNYYIGAIVDYNNTRLESNEDNNTLAGNLITITPGADLMMTAVNGPASATRGTPIAINNTVVNQGQGIAASFYIGLYVSTDASITSGDKYLGRRKINSLAILGTNSGATTVTLPAKLSPGTYYIGAIADYNNLRMEQNENNNALAGNTIQIMIK